jgi:hypothetical protein
MACVRQNAQGHRAMVVSLESVYDEAAQGGEARSRGGAAAAVPTAPPPAT